MLPEKERLPKNIDLLAGANMPEFQRPDSAEASARDEHGKAISNEDNANQSTVSQRAVKQKSLERGAQMFDGFCSLVEHVLNNEPSSITKRVLGVTEMQLLREAHVFLFPGRAHELLPSAVNKTRFGDAFGPSFALPFRCTVIIDTASLILLYDVKENAIGMTEPRFFMEYDSLTADTAKEFREGAGPSAHDLGFRSGTGLITWGSMENLTYMPRDDDSGRLSSRVEIIAHRAAYMHKKDGIVHETSLAELRLFGEQTGGNARAAIEELVYAEVQNQFIVQRTKVGERPKLHPNLIPRSDCRPIYLMMGPHEFRDTIGLSHNTGEPTSRISHWRRAHWRTYRHERYRFKQGSRVRITAKWIGPKEGMDPAKKNRYRVNLDL